MKILSFPTSADYLFLADLARLLATTLFVFVAVFLRVDFAFVVALTRDFVVLFAAVDVFLRAGRLVDAVILFSCFCFTQTCE